VVCEVGLSFSLAISPTVCDDSDPGTREGFILVSKTPPRTSRKAAKTNGNGVAPPADGDGTARRAELADFLRNRREAIRPEAVGLPGGGRRRTPGLRREEVAQLAGVGTTWYTWLEQGRDVRASASVLEAISGALALTPAERAHLMLLGRGEEVAPGKLPQEQLEPTIERLVERLGPSPAYVSGWRWDFLTWNRAYAAVFGEPLPTPDGRLNSLWTIFMDPARRKLHGDDWAVGARRVTARFRSETTRHVGEPDFESLVSALREGSPEFDRWWGLHEVTSSGVGRKLVNHPVVGRLHFEHAAFRLEDSPDRRLVLYTPAGAKTGQKLAELCGDS
jgi:transcriptional regulator with XRE-family HTH domain